jgi:hypothetical protein
MVKQAEGKEVRQRKVEGKEVRQRASRKERLKQIGEAKLAKLRSEKG